jgi:hypothetical protein
VEYVATVRFDEGQSLGVVEYLRREGWVPAQMFT